MIKYTNKQAIIMSLYWRKFQTNQNTDLPQTIMRPFWHPEAENLNEEVFSTFLSHEKPKILPYLMLLATLILFYFSIYGFILFENNISNIKKWNDNEIIYILSHTAAILVGIIFIVLFFKVKRKIILKFNRKTHAVCFTKNLLLTKHLDYNYDEFSGAIECYKSIFGQRKIWLVLNHKTEKLKIRLSFTYSSPQNLIGYWSFIVQYMKKNAPLPSVPALYEYPNKIEGVLHT